MVGMNRLILALLAVLFALPALAADRAAVEREFQGWLVETVWPAAAKAGVSRTTFDGATKGLTLNWKLPDLVPPGSPPKTTNGAFQAEFTGPAAYLAENKLAKLASVGAKRAEANAKTLAAVERATGVPAGIIVAIWGKESAYGAAEIPHAAVRTLATQAFIGGRKEIFLPELIAALVMIENDHVTPNQMKSSWAGAMGQPQFMPTKYLEHAVDFDRDGRRDIWKSVPDTLASIGYFLRDHGWQAGVPWGLEVMVPASVSCTFEGPDSGHPVEDWAAAGVTDMDGRPVSRASVGPTGHLLMPAGRLGPAFLVSKNFYVLKDYNESDLYALLVAHVSDRLTRPERIQGSWAKIAGHTRGDVRRMQIALERMGHDVGGTDGLVGWRTRVAIGRWQEASGLAATCFPDQAAFAGLK